MKKNDLKLIDFLYGSIAFLISLFLWFYLIPTQIQARESNFSEVAMIPRFAVAVIAATSLLLAILRIKEIGNLKEVFNPANYEFRWKILARQIVFIILMLLYIRVIPVCGFILASAVFVFIMLFYFGSRVIWKNSLIAVVFSFVIYLLFSSIFKVSLPTIWIRF